MQGQTKVITIHSGHHIWTRKVGSGAISLLLVHGGPGATHEYLECFSEYLPLNKYTLYFYDQLDSYYSDQPNDSQLWTIERFCEEIEDVRHALDLSSFYLLGQSWGGLLTIEYALKYSAALKGVIISNMAASIGAYVRHLDSLRQRLPQEVQQALHTYEAQESYHDPHYQLLILNHLYKQHLCRLDPWPMAVHRSMDRMNAAIYEYMQGPNEFVVTGTFKNWNRWDDLQNIKVPSLVIGGRFDTMDPADLQLMGERIPGGQTVICEQGSHMCMWDDPDGYYPAIEEFIDRCETIS